jgi:saccharopine dehydrogenase-like NADP-dependent oxidoreductase
MRVVVLGGAGEVGAEVARELAAVPEIDSLLIADIDGRRAESLAAGLSCSRVDSTWLDVRDPEAALPLLEGAQLLMNCTSFALFDAVLDLALRAGIDYADLISEPSEKQHQAARDRGITAISGLGASPGLSNVLVREAAEELDELHEVDISWISLRSLAPTPGLLDTILWELSEDCPTRRYYRNAEYRPAGFLEGSREVEFAEPVGRQFVYYVPHTEVTTLPRHFPALRDCAVRGSWRPELMQDIQVLNRYGLLTQTSLESTKQAIWERCGGARDAGAWMLYINVETVGVRGSQVIRRTCRVSHPAEWGERGMARMTGIPAAVGALLLARRGRVATGFVDPEEYYDPREFVTELDRRNAIKIERAEVALEPQVHLHSEV